MISEAMREHFTSLLHTHVPGLHVEGDQANGHVPWREDNHPSFAADLSKGVWYDRARGEGGGVKDFKERLGLNGSGQQKSKIVATYPYHNQNHILLYEKLRSEPKNFLLRRPDGNDGWIYDLKGVERVLYRLPELLAADLTEPVLLPEGEKDTERLRSEGFIATCNPGGANEEWREAYSKPLTNRPAVILLDNDKPGEHLAWQKARALLPVTAWVKLVRLPGLAPLREKHGEDVSDWLDQGHTREELADLIEATPILRPEDLPPEGKKGETLRVTLRRPSELVARPISWRVETIIPDGMLSVLHAKDKVGKTLFAWEAARAVLRNTALVGTFSVTSGRVVLALLDDPHDLTVQRRDALGLRDCENLRIVTPLDADLSDPPAFLADFRKACEEFKPDLIVLDALYQFAPPSKDSMNDIARMRGIMAEFNALAETLPAAVLLIAHDKKDGSDLAGSYVIRATAKALLHLTKPKWSNEDEEEDDGRRILTVVSKMTGEARHLLRCQGVGAWSYLGRGDSAHQARTTWAQDRVLTWLKEGQEGTVQEVAKGVRIRREDALSALTALVEEEQVISELRPRADGKKGKGRLVYHLARPNVPDPGTDSPKESDGNNSFSPSEPAKINSQRGIPNVPSLWNQGGPIGQATEASKINGSGERQTYCSQDRFSREEMDGNDSVDDPCDSGGFDWETGEQEEQP